MDDDGGMKATSEAEISRIAKEAADWVAQNNTMLACPGTEQGKNGWYYDTNGDRCKYKVRANTNGEEDWWCGKHLSSC